MSGIKVLRNARLVRFDGDGYDALREHADSAIPELVDVAMVDGRITAVGTRLETRGDEEVDLDGRWLMPGLWDNHVHMTQWALDRQRVDVSSARSAAEAANIVAKRAALTPPPDGTLLVGRGFRDALWPDEPTAKMLDGALAAAGAPAGVGVVLVSGDLHCAWLNTPALARLGASEHPTGLLREAEWMPRMGAIDDVDPKVLDRWVAEAAQAAAERGVIGIVDFEIADNLTTWTRRINAGQRSLRVDAGVWPENLDRAIALELASGDEIAGTGGLLRLGALKVITDGSLNTRTAYCHDPYPGLDGDHAHGILNVPTDELTALLSHAHRHGINAAVHAIGDRANTLALAAFEASGARGSIEHAQLLRPDDVARMARLGLVASVQPEHAMDDRDVADHHWAGRTDGAFPLADLAAAGVPLAFGSDAPVAPLDPWQAIASAVFRTRDDREPWHPEQRLNLATALASSVRSRVDGGAPADLVILDANPASPTTADALRDVSTALTLVAGQLSAGASDQGGVTG